jgi:hypothetical protein
MWGWWGRATAESRLRFAVIAVIGWVLLLLIAARDPRGEDWVFIAVAPFYFAFFVYQIRRAWKDRQG